MPIIHDDEFGKITIRRNPQSRHIRIRVAPDSTLRVSAPAYTPMFLVKRMITSSRNELRSMLQKQTPELTYESGSAIGKSHSLLVREGSSLKIARHGLQISVTLPESKELSNPDVQAQLREHIIAALRREAKGYLPKRLKYLADSHDFAYSKVRFSHASGRWGSCSSSGTISLNIALMKLPFELIDYVLIHELAHTRHMNHSSDFWEVVATYDPSYKLHRSLLKKEAPII